MLSSLVGRFINRRYVCLMSFWNWTLWLSLERSGIFAFFARTTKEAGESAGLFYVTLSYRKWNHLSVTQDSLEGEKIATRAAQRQEMRSHRADEDWKILEEVMKDFLLAAQSEKAKTRSSEPRVVFSLIYTSLRIAEFYINDAHCRVMIAEAWAFLQLVRKNNISSRKKMLSFGLVNQSLYSQIN